jgi:hypothetical protein
MDSFIGGVLVTLLILVLVSPIRLPSARDDTDPPGARSGLGLLTDHKTGLQYLSTARGGVTPRLDPDGKHMKAE